MPYDSNGLFTRMHSWEDDRKNEIDIVSDRHDEEDDNFADGLSLTFLRDGRIPMQGNIDMGNFQIKNLANGAVDTDVLNKKQITAAIDKLADDLKTVINSSFAVGDIKASGLKQDYDNWLLCDGRELERTEYAELYAAIGTAFGEGNKITTFNIPDCRGVVLRGVDGGRGLDAERELGSYQGDAVVEHHHWVANATNSGVNDGISPDTVLTGNNTGEWYGARLRGSSEPATGGKSSGVKGVESENVAAETRMKNLAVNYFIKAKKD